MYAKPFSKKKSLQKAPLFREKAVYQGKIYVYISADCHKEYMWKVSSCSVQRMRNESRLTNEEMDKARTISLCLRQGIKKYFGEMQTFRNAYLSQISCIIRSKLFIRPNHLRPSCIIIYKSEQ